MGSPTAEYRFAPLPTVPAITTPVSMPVWMGESLRTLLGLEPCCGLPDRDGRSQRHLSLVVVGYRSPEQGEKTIWASTLHSPTKALHARGRDA